MQIRILGLLLIPALMMGCSTSQPNSIATSTPAPTTSPPLPSGVPTMGSLEPSQTVVSVSKAVIGMTEAEATQTIEGVSSEQLSFRIARRDSEFYALTLDYRPNRINLEIDNGIVTSTSIN